MNWLLIIVQIRIPDLISSYLSHVKSLLQWISVCVLLTSLSSGHILSQNQNQAVIGPCIDCGADSVMKNMSNAHSAEDSLFALIAIIDNIGGPEYHKELLVWMDRLIQLNAHLQLINSDSYILYREGILMWNKGDQKGGIENFKKAIDVFDAQKKVLGNLSLLNVIREYFNYANLQEERLHYFEKKLIHYQHHGPIENTATCYHAIAGYYAYKSNYNIAISYYLKSAEIYQSFSLYGYYYELSAAGTYYYIWGNYDRAKYYLQIVYDRFLKEGNREKVMGANIGLALIEKKRKNYVEALKNIDEALEILIQNPVLSFKALSLAEKGGILIEMNRLNEAYQSLVEARSIGDSISLPMVSIQGDFEIDYYFYLYHLKQKEIAKAETMLVSAYHKAAAGNLDGLIQKYRKALFNFYMDSKRLGDAAAFGANYIRFNDSLVAVQNSNNISDFEKQQKEKANLEKVQRLQFQKAQQRNYFIISGILLLLAILAIYSRLQFMRKTKQQLEEKNIEIQNEKLKAEQSERFKQQFIANMSHEIRTPMNAVMGMTNLLIDKGPRADQHHYLDGIRKSSETLLHIINDILDLSKIEAGKIELEQIDFSLSEVIGQVEQMLLQKADEKEIRLIVEIDKNIPVLIGDPVRLYQVFMNLVGNAIKFTEEGYVRVTASMTEKVDNIVCIQFAIIDTGIGIPSNKLESVFESFNQAHASDTRRYGGTGLGLSISRQLIELLGGNITIESEEGTGTIFSFVLNFEQGSEERLQQRNEREGSIDGSILNGLKILIVDDNDYNLIVAMDTLKLKADVSVITATNGKEAISCLQENDFDIILMDVQMPEMNGLEATRYIRKHFDLPKKEIPIIALTASVLRTDLDKCKQAGMNAYIPKPFKVYQLIKGIADLLSIEIKSNSAIVKSNQVDYSPEDNIFSITNLTYLRSFCEGDRTRMKKYIKMFLDSAPLLVDKLKSALDNKNYIEMADQIHAFKTKWIMMGMNETKILSDKIEEQCRNESLDDSINENVLTLINHIEEAGKELS